MFFCPPSLSISQYFGFFHLTSVLTISKFQMSHGDHYIVTMVTIPPFEILGIFFSHLFF